MKFESIKERQVANTERLGTVILNKTFDGKSFVAYNKEGYGVTIVVDNEIVNKQPIPAKEFAAFMLGQF